MLSINCRSQWIALALLMITTLLPMPVAGVDAQLDASEGLDLAAVMPTPVDLPEAGYQFATGR